MNVLDLIPDSLDIMVLMPFGSHLYGTANEYSDRDFKGIFLPTKRQILLGNTPKTWTYSSKAGNEVQNTPEDVEIGLYSFYYFIELVKAGEMIALDMLHASDTHLIVYDDWWDYLHQNRKCAYSKSIKGYVQYARKQAAKYGIKGSRINVLDTLIDIYKDIDENVRLGDTLKDIPELEYCKTEIGTDNLTTKLYVDGRTFIGTTPVKYFYRFLLQHRSSYGNRAELAAKNEGVDWKAVSHAFRAFIQFKHVLLEGDFTYPLPETSYIKSVKQGELDFNSEVLPALDKLSEEVDLLAFNSELPEEVDKDKWAQWRIP